MKPETIAELEKPLDSRHIRPPQQFGPKGDYLEGWHVIAEANRIFGFDGWSYEAVDTRCVSEAPRKIGKAQKEGWGVTYTSRVRVTVDGIVREDFGAGHGYDVDLGLAHESAIKEAITDALKRCLRTFGNPFGLALYDKTRANVVDVAAEESHAVSKADARPIFATLMEDMRRQKSKDDLRRWIADPEVKGMRQKLPPDWDANLKQEAADYGNTLPNQYQNVTMAG
jgi:DNA recombination protein Rad52